MNDKENILNRCKWEENKLFLSTLPFNDNITTINTSYLLQNYNLINFGIIPPEKVNKNNIFEMTTGYGYFFDKNGIKQEIYYNTNERDLDLLKNNVNVNKNATCKCDIQFINICKCDNPNYKLFKLNNSLICENAFCKKWACRCL